MSDQTTPGTTPPATEPPATEPHDFFHRVTKWVSYNRWTFLSLIMAAAAVTLAGCQFKATSPVSGERLTSRELADEQAKAKAKLAREQAEAAEEFRIASDSLRKNFDNELAKLAAKFEATTKERMDAAADMDRGYETAQADIERKNQIANGVFGLAQQALAAAPPSLLGGMAVGALSLAGGLFLDNRRKNGVISELKQA